MPTVGEATRFQKGKSGNPLGCSVGRVSFKAILDKVLKEAMSPEDKRTKAEVIAHELVDAALDGQEWAIKECLDRMDGKAKQQIDMNVHDDRSVPDRISSLHSRIAELRGESPN